MIVVDASVAALWSLPQDHADLARDVLGSGIQLIAPSILRLEAANPILRAVRRGEMGPDQARRFLEVLLPQSVQLTQVLADDLRAFEIAHAHGGSVLDAVYVALAHRVGARLVTNDRQMHRTAVASGVRVRLLPEGPPW
jgi:predicted nucleic acid-binding protein